MHDHPQPHPAAPRIGVFDSGFGGLTVLRALLHHIPAADYLYLGDTARLPYGAKSQTTIARYAVESATFLAAQGCDLLVIACNTATALALPEIRSAVAIPVIGVIEPGARAALTATDSLTVCTELSSRPKSPLFADAVQSGVPDGRSWPDAVQRPVVGTASVPHVLVLATAATVQSHAYRDACTALNLHATEKACPLLVPLVEEGWIDHPVTRDVLRIYLTEALALCTPDVVLLGCTHYPLLAAEIERTLRDLGSPAIVIDSAEATALAAAGEIAARKVVTRKVVEKDIVILSEAKDLLSSNRATTITFYATDSTEKFARLGSRFLGQPIPHVTLLDLGG